MSTWIIILLAIIILFILFILSITVAPPSQSSHANDIATTIQIIARQCGRWSTASLQDQSPLVAWLHANYGAGYLFALMDCFPSETIRQAMGLSLNEFEAFRHKIVGIQDIAAKRVISACPAISDGLDKELSRLGGEGI